MRKSLRLSSNCERHLLKSFEDFSRANDVINIRKEKDLGLRSREAIGS